MPLTIDLRTSGAGTFSIEDDGIAGNGTSRVLGPSGNIVTTFAHPTDSLTILTRTGQSIDVNITDSLTTANVTIGSLVNANANPDSINVGNILTSGIVSLAANESISELGDDAATDIVAGTLLLKAGTGIGDGNAIETQVSTLEAESVRGGIALSNIGNLQIGGGSTTLRGLFSEISGDIAITNQGSIVLSDATGAESVHSAGNVTLTAIGLTSDISGNVNRDGLSAVDNIVLTAGRDVSFGTAGFGNDVHAGGGVTIHAGRDFNIADGADLAADFLFQDDEGGVSITTGRDINVANGASVRVATGGGTVVLTTGIGGAFRLLAGSGLPAVSSREGGVVINADRLTVETNSGVSAVNGGTVTISTASAGRAVNLGSASDGATALELSDAELDRVNAGTLIVGGAATGDVVVVGPLTPSAANLEVRSGRNIAVKANITTSTSLILQAAGSMSQNAASTINTGAFTARVDTPDNDSAGGTLTLAGAVTAASRNLFGNADEDTLNGSTGADIMQGGAGDDIYVVNNAGDQVIEARNAGADTVRSSVSFSLVGQFADHITLTGTADIDATGNTLGNNLTGNSGNNVLDGGGGIDALFGGLGNDTYVVDRADDVVVEAFGEGTDTVKSSIARTLVSNFENLVLTGTADINGTGNTLDNTVTGNSGKNTLAGGESGADTLAGAADNDTYIVDRAGITIVELSNAGIDLVRSSISFNLGGKQVENLTLTGTADINGTGNSFANTIVGNTGKNQLNGGTGLDTLTGGSGADTFFFNTALGATNIDSITDFNVAADTIQLDDAVFNTIVGTGTLSLAQFAANASGTAQDADDRIIYDTDSGQLFFDSNGSGAGGSTQFATVAAGLALTANDFFVV